MLSLVVPAYSAGPDLERTIHSVNSICDDVVIISTAFYPEDIEQMKKLARVVVDVPWNFVFQNGYGNLHNCGADYAGNDWLLLLGVAETWATGPSPDDLHRTLQNTRNEHVFRCDHENDIHSWKRIWNRNSCSKWSGLIHEEIVGGKDAGLLFRMLDTPKTPRADKLENEVLRYLKTCSYNLQYWQLLTHPNWLGGADKGWLKFVDGARESIQKFCFDHFDLLWCATTGDRQGFIDGVRNRLEHGQFASGVIFKPQGT